MAGNETFRKLLDNELKHRQNKNRHYSIREFAKELGLEHSFLAKLLNGSRTVTPLTIRRVSPHLGLSSETSSLYLDEILQKKASKSKRSGTYSWLNVITPEKFDPVSEWYYTAILTAMALPEFDPRPQWIAKTIGISQDEAELAMARLQQNGYFEIKNGHHEPVQKQNSVLPKAQTNSNLKRYQKQSLFKAIDAIESTALEARDHATVTVATSQEMLEKVKPMIRAFRRKLMKMLEEVDSPDTLYNFTTALYPISQKVKRGNSK